MSASRDAIRILLELGRRKKQAIQICLDCATMALAFAGAMWLRLERVDVLSNLAVWTAFLPSLPMAVLVFWRAGLYRSVLRFISGKVLIAVGLGALAASATLFVCAQVLGAPVPRSVPAIFGVLLFGGLGGVRFLARFALRGGVMDRRQSVVIYGAGDAGRQLHNALNDGREYNPVAFVDDDETLHGAIIGGRRVFAPASLPELFGSHPGAAVLLALPSATRARRREIVSELEKLCTDIRTIPGMADIVSGRTSFSELRRVAPEDLLGREPIPPLPQLMGKHITGKVVLVTGAGGSIGSELCRQIVAHFPAALILVEMSEIALYTITNELRERVGVEGRKLGLEPILGSVLDYDRMCSAFRAFGVQTVYHAAAYKHVTLVEENVCEGIRTNMIGTRALADAAVVCGVESFTLVSTDKAVRPTNVMGASKRLAELVCQAKAQEQATTRFSMVRFGNVLGSSGSVIPRFRAQIEQGGPVTVTHRDITRYFMTISEASQLVIQASAMAEGGDVFVLDMGEPVRILDLAQSMIRLHGVKPYIIGEDGAPTDGGGDIGIKITGLSKGEKLFEELLIGNEPQSTAHPRIMRAKEIALSADAMNSFLRRFEDACRLRDMPTVRTLLIEAPLGYSPNDEQLHDLVWKAAQNGKSGAH